MSGRITISPEQVEQIARQFKQSSEESRQIVLGLTQAVQGMESDWEGVTKQRFIQEFEEADKQMKYFAQILESISEELNSISQRFRSIDQNKF
ncbi:WXG100 family type VII secretion target [Paenibacillus shirakamiensis]|uniref:ESAT-6-like protein n=1 Tax=Paenibacillus shirakamiensis TaxID=1265935 RepID=A0ABS4JH01_9BACL|nr:WXG100 family type VII secretion target [Paenibacillus shirakamiensis]MBP2001000.1 WXG100 family type VII secretion target [Paenibacillus shirakamiensis]